MIDFTDAIHEAIEKFHCRPTKIISDFKLVGINMSQEMINLIEKQGVVYNKSENNSPCYFGIPVYKKEGITRVQYIIEGKIEGFNKYLTWEDLEVNKSVKVNLNGTQGVVTLLSFSSTYGKNPCYEAEICLQNNYGKDFIIRLREEESSIFNNLHLEIIE